MASNLSSHKHLNYFIILLFLSVMSSSCSKDDDSSGNETPIVESSGLTIYKNQTGNPDADALQARYVDDAHAINIYGKFNIYDEPSVAKTLTFQKKDNDTLVNFILDPVTSRISSSFLTVNGERLPVIMKFTYPKDGSSSVSVSLYDYNWTNRTSELIFATLITGETGEARQYPFYATKTSSSQSDWLAGVAVGIGVAEVVAAVGGGWSILPAAAATVSAAATVAVPVAIGAAIVITTTALSAILNDANASEIMPSDAPYPEGVPVHNPLPEEEDPSPDLKDGNCSSNNIDFKAFMDQEGTIVVEDISGGEPPYKYFVNNDVQETQIFGNNYADGNYMISVKDANGCIKSKHIPMTRDSFDIIGTWSLLIVSDGETADQVVSIQFNEDRTASLSSGDLGSPVSSNYSLTGNSLNITLVYSEEFSCAPDSPGNQIQTINISVLYNPETGEAPGKLNSVISYNPIYECTPKDDHANFDVIIYK